MTVDIFELIDACCEVYDDPSMQPTKDSQGNLETYCNLAVQAICAHVGYNKFYHMMANQIVDFMECHPEEWEKIDISKAQETCNSGRLVICGLKMDVHGHVAVVRPGVAGLSVKWGNSPVPKVVNIGSKNMIGKSINWVMADKPNAYALK